MHDPGLRRTATRAGRQKGCYIYIPADVLKQARIDPDGPLPHYRTWAGRSAVVVRFYKER